MQGSQNIAVSGDKLRAQWPTRQIFLCNGCDRDAIDVSHISFHLPITTYVKSRDTLLCIMSTTPLYLSLSLRVFVSIVWSLIVKECWQCARTESTHSLWRHRNTFSQYTVHSSVGCGLRTVVRCVFIVFCVWEDTAWDGRTRNTVTHRHTTALTTSSCQISFFSLHTNQPGHRISV